MKLYRMNATLEKIESHEIGENCLPQLVDRYPNYGDLYRCRTNEGSRYHDFYGYMKRKCAKKEAEQLIRQEINRLTQLLKEYSNETD